MPFHCALPAWALGQWLPVVGGPVFAILIGMVITLVMPRKRLVPQWRGVYL